MKIALQVRLRNALLQDLKQAFKLFVVHVLGVSAKLVKSYALGMTLLVGLTLLCSCCLAPGFE